MRSVPLTLDDEIDWGQACQVFRLERWCSYRERQGRDRYRYTVTCGITSQEPEKADGARLLALVCGHWGIEVRSHWIQDTTLPKNASRTATGRIIQILTGIRCTALTLLHRYRQAQELSIVSAARQLQQDLWLALRLVWGST